MDRAGFLIKEDEISEVSLFLYLCTKKRLYEPMVRRWLPTSQEKRPQNETYLPALDLGLSSLLNCEK